MTDDVRKGDLLAGKYRVERTLGRGGMGIVYLAKHVELDKHVAVKLMLPEATKSEESVARFVREARAAAKILSQHVVRVSDVGMHEGTRPYMAMEYLQGSDLHQLLAERKRLPLADTAEYLLQALEALAEAHALGIVHRDLKPENLFVTQRPHDTPIVKVLDFGISKIASGELLPASPLTNVSALVGSPLYMSPEQMKASKDVDQRADIWALGIILHELLTGEVPFKGETLPELCAVIVLEADPPRARDWVPELPAAIDDVIARCLARNVEARFADAAELACALAPFAPERARVSVDRITAVLSASPRFGSKSGVATPSPASEARRTSTSWVDSAPRGLKRRGTLALIPALGLVALGLAVLFARHSDQAPAERANASSPSPTATPSPDPTAQLPQPPVTTAPPAPSSAGPVPGLEPSASAAGSVIPSGSKRRPPSPLQAPTNQSRGLSEFGGRR
jgi:serine/threonine-protein kinase